MNRLKEIEERLNQIKAEMDNEGVDINALSDEADALLEERKALLEENEKRSALLGKIAGGELGNGLDMKPQENEAEKRAKEFVMNNKLDIEARSILVSGGTIAKPTKVSGIMDGNAPVCSIVDMVTVEDCSGMGADTVAYVNTESDASAGTEGSAATTSEGIFGTVSITPSIYNLVSYISREVQNQSPLNYTAKVQAQALKALRKKASAVITAAATNSALKDTVTVSAIDSKTLRNIVLGYGAETEIGSNAVLFLNKKDLIAFGDVRGTNEKKAVYEITPDGANPNTGVIKDGGLSVKYCINPDCKAIDDATTGDVTMFYGDPASLKLDLFGKYTVETSKDYKFAEGLLAVLGTMSIGAGLVVKGGISAVVKG